MRKKRALLAIGVLLVGAFALAGCGKIAWVGPVEQACNTSGTVDVTFHWTSASEGNGFQFLDLSLYSTFPPNQFISPGPMPSNQNAFYWPGLTPNAVHHWRINTLIDGVWYTSWTGTFTTSACGIARGEGEAPTAGMRMVIPRIGVNAPVNVRVMGSDGVMGKPNGKDDAIWYDFSPFGGLGGFPGVPRSNAVFSGHVDFHPNFTAVFWDVRQLVPGDEIDVYLLDGTAVRYVVQWSKWIGDEENFADYAVRTGDEILTIVTCTGTFDPTTRNYSNRLVVRAVRF
jgi:hypothetical protein